MATVYVTETFRHLGRAGNLRVFEGVQARVSDKPEDNAATVKFYGPADWRALLAQPDVLYRYKNEEYHRPHV